MAKGMIQLHIGGECTDYKHIICITQCQKLENLDKIASYMDKMEKLLEIYKLPKLTQYMVENLSAPITTKETEKSFQGLPTKHMNT